MADHSKIEWTDATWNPVTGCSVVSPGCTNCYAMKLAGTRLKHHPSRAGLTTMTKAGPVWNGEIRFNEQWLDQPLRWQKPRMIFVCAHGDMFAEGVTNAMLDRIFAVMALCAFQPLPRQSRSTPLARHTFQILTKRSDRMREYFTQRWTYPGNDGSRCVAPRSSGRPDARARIFMEMLLIAKSQGIDVKNLPRFIWPLANVWLGVSVEDQTRADERIPDLLATPAAIRFISAEPLLGPVDLIKGLSATGGASLASSPSTAASATPCLDWVIVGGESGKGARPMHPDWARSIRDQCASAGVPFFFKQWGAYLPAGQLMADGRPWAPASGNNLHATKALAGRFLDGIEHNAMPQTRKF